MLTQEETAWSQERLGTIIIAGIQKQLHACNIV